MNGLRTFNGARPTGEPERPLTILQVCQPEVYLLDVKDPALVFYALSECTKILNYLRRDGYVLQAVGRDSIMLRAKTVNEPSDLGDFASRYTVEIAIDGCNRYVPSAHETAQHLRTQGHPYFMPLEVATCRHQFVKNKSDATFTSRFFARNPFHDLESILWIALHTLLPFTPLRPVGAKDWDSYRSLLGNVRARMQRLFPQVRRHHNSIDFDCREVFLKRGKYRDGLKTLLGQVYGESSPVLKLIDLFDDLVWAYRKVEGAANFAHSCEDRGSELPANTRIDPALFEEHAGIYGRIHEALKAVCAYLTNAQVQLIRVDDVDQDTGAPLVFQQCAKR
ncbi:uncharacterized protein SCHCODRAFT_02564718 [Schizophyllum commune H4-8]|nr:uncharacterized protein SCHCODRAFT_02564718 [Schizophyllum commune H4-8]KAI5897668.1 hypothetical protein SCHCODRAFT_02564718 [Schizophyllum commune H4-8]